MYRDAVLLSIKPKWCELITSGEKTIEIRKTKPKIYTPFTCYIYCTIVSNISDKLQAEKVRIIGNLNHIPNGKIIGEFECDRIDAFNVFDNWNVADLDSSCLTYDEVTRYIGLGKTGYAWHISKLKIYDKPKELSEFRMQRPPQSWCYVDGII